MRNNTFPQAALLLLLSFLIRPSHQLLQSQNDTFTSTFQLTRQQILAANLSAETAHNVEIALEYERSGNAGVLIQDDPFYDLPASYDAANPPPAGTIIKVEEFTNISLYTLPMSVSMSRFLYTTETYNGSVMPASAYVLWPYLPRAFSGLTPCSNNTARDSNAPLFPVIALAHGTSGQTQACAPSGLRALWDDFHEPFPMALAGYAVVAPDYLGLGVGNVTSPYFVLPSQANDVVYAVEAARSAWPHSLSREFVVAGQSQGGGVAWSVAQRQAEKPVEGYLGTMAASPFTNILADVAGESVAEVNGRVVGIAQGIDTVRPDFNISDWVTDAGIARLKLLQEIKGCGITGGQLFSGDSGTVQILKDGWNLTESASWYNNISSNGGKPVAGPMLVIQGDSDPNAYEPATTAGVKQTCSAYPNTQIQYIRWENITHVPVLYAGQHVYLDFIRDLFEGVEQPKGCSEKTYAPARGFASANFQGFADQTWFVEYDEYGI